MITLSFTESEYITLSEAGWKVLWVCQFLEDCVGFVFNKPTTIFEDNQSFIAFT
jgi:hypothetical protein